MRTTIGALSRCFGVGIMVLYGCGGEVASPVTVPPTLVEDTSGGSMVGPQAQQPDVVERSGAGEDTASGPTSSLLFDPMGPGPFEVGYREQSHIYSLPTPLNGDRVIVLHFWYPTEAPNDEAPLYVDFWPDEDASVDAPAAAPVDSAGYPVMVYSHGDVGFGADSAFQMRHFASHGWLAVGIDHIGNVRYDNAEGETVEIFAKRALDVSAALDVIAALPDEDMLSRADTSEVLSTGHSRGTSTVWALCGASIDPSRDIADLSEELQSFFLKGFRDDRVVASVLMDGLRRGGLYGEHGYATSVTPMMFQAGLEEYGNAKKHWEAIPYTDISLVEISGGCHQTFALGACSTLPAAEGFAIVGAFNLAMGRHHVLGDTSETIVGILNGDVSVSERAVVSLK